MKYGTWEERICFCAVLINKAHRLDGKTYSVQYELFNGDSRTFELI